METRCGRHRRAAPLVAVHTGHTRTSVTGAWHAVSLCWTWPMSPRLVHVPGAQHTVGWPQVTPVGRRGSLADLAGTVWLQVASPPWGMPSLRNQKRKGERARGASLPSPCVVSANISLAKALARLSPGGRALQATEPRARHEQGRGRGVINAGGLPQQPRPSGPEARPLHGFSVPSLRARG